MALLARVAKAAWLRGTRRVRPAHETRPRDVFRRSCKLGAKLSFILSVLLQAIGIDLGGRTRLSQLWRR
jgi:hypothetical protein